VRVVVAGHAPLPMGARVFSPALVERTIVLAPRASSVSAQCRSAGISVREVAPAVDGLPDLLEGFRALYSDGIGSILVEGGSRLITALIARDLWDALTVFIAPMILGAGREAVGDLGIASPDSGIRLRNARFEQRDGFMRLDGRNPKGCTELPKGAPYPEVAEGPCSQD